MKQIVRELTATERRMPSATFRQAIIPTVVRGAGRKLEDLSAVRCPKMHLLATKKAFAKILLAQRRRVQRLNYSPVLPPLPLVLISFSATIRWPLPFSPP